MIQEIEFSIRLCPVGVHPGLGFPDEAIIASGGEEVGEVPPPFQIFLHRQAGVGDLGMYHLSVHVFIMRLDSVLTASQLISTVLL